MLRYLVATFVLFVVFSCCQAEKCGYNYCTYNEYCCSDFYSECCYLHTTQVGVWAGSVISCLVVGGIILTIGICCCNSTCPLYRRYRGHVIQTNVTSGTTAVVTTFPYVQTGVQGYHQPPYTQLQTPTGQVTPQGQPGGYTPPQTAFSNPGYVAGPPSYEQAASQPPAAPEKSPPYNPEY